MKYYNLIFAVFHMWRLAITTLDKQSCFYYNLYINTQMKYGKIWLPAEL